MSQSRYWNLLLHNVNGTSEIDDEKFFFAKDGKNSAQSELNATIDALFSESVFNDSSAACRFPARRDWLIERLNITMLPKAECREFDKVLNRLKPKSVTLVFPSAHINSPASMFGHTFLRINSAYDSKLLSYAVNYAADADPDKENAVIFAIKGLFGGYFGKYSLLPYYDKLKEYRDSEQRDIWEYDLNFNEEETLRMLKHIWELNETHSYYYFFTQNCSYNMLWFLEIAREEVHLRDYFSNQIIPLETLHAAKSEKLIVDYFYRPSKRSTILKYEELIKDEHKDLVLLLLESSISEEDIIGDERIEIEQKRYILEVGIELLEYRFSKSQIEKEEYLRLFHSFSKARAKLGIGEKIVIKTPPNPIESHQAIRASMGGGVRDAKPVGFFGMRPAYHDLADSSYGFLRGTQIEFLDLEISYTKEKIDLEKATILSIVSLAQRGDFFKNISWRTKFGWDRNSFYEKAAFIGTVGIGLSWGNELGYLYVMADPLFYVDKSHTSALGSSIGAVFDGSSNLSTIFEATRRWYDEGFEQYLFNVSQTFRASQNTQLKLKYDYKERRDLKEENSLVLYLNYYF